MSLWATLAQLGSSYLQGKAASDASEASRLAGEQLWKRSQPWDVGGMFGQAKFDSEGNRLDFELSDEWKQQYDQQLMDADAQKAYISEMEADPMAAGQKFYEMQKQLYAPEQEKDRLSLENRLLGQGMLGATGGAGQMGALLQAQGQQDLQAQYAGLQQAQSMIDTYRGRQGAALQAAQGIGALTEGYGDMGAGIGRGLSVAAEAAAKIASDAAQAKGATMNTIGKNVGNQFGGLVNRGGGFLDSGNFPKFGTNTTGAKTGGLLYGQSPMMDIKV